MSTINVVPKLGRVYVTETHVLFWSNLLGVRTRAIIPIEDILLAENVQGQLGFWYGIYIALRHGETWLEFLSAETRKQCLQLLR